MSAMSKTSTSTVSGSRKTCHLFGIPAFSAWMGVMPGGRAGSTKSPVSRLAVSESSDVTIPLRSMSTSTSGSSLKTQILGSRSAHPNGVGMTHQPPTQISGMSNPTPTLSVSHFTSSSLTATVLSARRSTVPFSRCRATA